MATTKKLFHSALITSDTIHDYSLSRPLYRYIEHSFNWELGLDTAGHQRTVLFNFNLVWVHATNEYLNFSTRSQRNNEALCLAGHSPLYPSLLHATPFDTLLETVFGLCVSYDQNNILMLCDCALHCQFTFVYVTRTFARDLYQPEVIRGLIRGYNYTVQLPPT